ncbi:hypothetical protein N7493_007723 [Penicillium malachiteum]|uniref:AAA+ ATPase domain-containing protein n=1 Tax=Penicillium malachiteum TaxID=1324776 RepID=A0AAD6HIA6_9EURO|nr:hypothetical protein N7493_007723 [Penicillium malachiteum]
MMSAPFPSFIPPRPENPGNSSKAQRTNQSEEAEKTQLTISDDRTNQREIDKRTLSVLGYETVGKETVRTFPTSILSERSNMPLPQGSHDLADYEMQVMLLKQQNKRLQMQERQRQEAMERHVINQEQLQTSQGVGNKDPKQTWSPLPSVAEKSSETPARQILWNPSERSADLNQTVPLSQIQPNTQDDRLSTKEVKALREQMSLLEAKLSQYESTTEVSSAPRFQYLYRLRQISDDDADDADGEAKPSSTIFLDPPEVVYDENKNGHLRCNIPLRDLNLFLALHQDISFVVFRDYNKHSEKDGSWSEDVPQAPCPLSESIYPVARGLKIACQVLFQKIAGLRDIEDQYESIGEIFAPYHFLYHSWGELDQLRNNLSSPAKNHLDLLLLYVQEGFGHEYATVTLLLNEEKITPRYLSYLFQPGEVIVEATGKDYIGYIASSWMIERTIKSNSENMLNIPGMPNENLNFQPPTSTPRKGARLWKSRQLKQEQRKVKHSAKHTSRVVNAWTLNFDGKFFRTFVDLTIKVPTGTLNGSEEPRICQDSSDLARPISCLNVFPLKYAPEAVRETLRRRGNTFWKCRDRRLVSYDGERSGQGVDMTDERYMVDMESYEKLHPTATLNANLNGQSTNFLRTAYINSSAINDPNGNYQFLLPLRIKAYNLRHKKWFEISADCISDVKWNREAFQSLVMERKSKELIQALVTSQIEAEKATDLISGKGSGLILLLHGGPGTGKTLTAESVAEIAEKPLYRVTCGDVGTNAEQVEKYLESVLYLGRIWGCVVLLDEADVFLEQRSLEDLERNALVSVFLRVLEYYDGILVLTSNRVGTFDEAFRSRIQLALHYPNLGPSQRFRIWQTFIDKLSNMSTDEQIDIDDLRDNLHLLKEEKMNGRQIRNVITTARQYAKWKKEPLTYEYMKDVIKISCRFDGYFSKLRGGFSDDEIAQDDGLRLA